LLPEKFELIQTPGASEVFHRFTTALTKHIMNNIEAVHPMAARYMSQRQPEPKDGCQVATCNSPSS